MGLDGSWSFHPYLAATLQTRGMIPPNPEPRRARRRMRRALAAALRAAVTVALLLSR